MKYRNFKNTDVFVGSGISSLILAIYHMKNTQRSVTILESQAFAGGANSSYQAVNGEKFDFGMRIYYETGIKDLDDIVIDSISENKLIFLEDNKKDPAACFFLNRIQTNSPCLDLRFLSDNKKKTILRDISTKKKVTEKDAFENCGDYLKSRFGNIVCEEFLFPILENFYLKSVYELTPEASTAHFGQNERVILFDEKKTLELMKDEYVRMRLAYPNQKSLPPPFSNRSGRGLYPKTLGMQNIIKGLVDSFLKLGGQIIFNAEPKEIIFSDSYVSGIYFHDKKLNERRFLKARNLFWSGPITSLASILGHDTDKAFEAGKKAYLAHIIVNKNLNIDDLYYLFNFDPNFDIFRITNYNAYCPLPSSSKGYKATIEYWSENSNLTFDNIYNELLEMGVLDFRHKLIYGELAPRGFLFPTKSVGNEALLNKMRDFIGGKKICNLLLFGQGSKKNTFYTTQILQSAFRDYNRLNFI